MNQWFFTVYIKFMCYLFDKVCLCVEREDNGCAVCPLMENLCNTPVISHTLTGLTGLTRFGRPRLWFENTSHTHTFLTSSIKIQCESLQLIQTHNCQQEAAEHTDSLTTT